MKIEMLAFMGWPEITAVLVIVFILFMARRLPELAEGLGRGLRNFRGASRDVLDELDEAAGGAGRSASGSFGRPVAEAITHWNETAEDSSRSTPTIDLSLKEPMNKFIVWLAQGFGIGRIPFAPGTWGSVLGVAWFLVLVRLTCEWEWSLPVGIIVGILVAVWACARAEKLLGKKDPQSVVLDEIAAIPLAMFTLIFLLYDFQNMAVSFLGFSRRNLDEPVGAVIGLSPPQETLADTIFTSWFTPAFAIYVTVGFVLFRFFDIWKPWPIRQSQRLPGGWGVVMDDVLAAVYVNLVMLAAWGVMRRMN